MTRRCQWLHGPELPKVEWVGVGIRLVERNQAHAVVLYKEAAGRIFELHFCWMRFWEHKEVTDRYHWVDLQIDPLEARALAASCAVLAEAKTLDRIPFAFRHDESSRIDLATGQIRLGASAHGFTCATFVLTLLASQNIRPVLTGSWRERSCDLTWQKGILTKLQRKYESETQQQKEELGTVRFRPEEVVACCGCSATPITFETALPLGRDLLADMDATHLACWFDPEHPSDPGPLAACCEQPN